MLQLSSSKSLEMTAAAGSVLNILHNGLLLYTGTADLHLAGHCSVSKTRKCSKYLFYKYQLPVLGGILASHFANTNKLLLLYFLIITEICF